MCMLCRAFGTEVSSALAKLWARKRSSTSSMTMATTRMCCFRVLPPLQSSLHPFFLLIAHACFLPTFSFQKVGLPDFTASTAELLRLRTFERTALASPRAGDKSASVAKTVSFKKPRTGALARRGKSKKEFIVCSMKALA